MKKKGLKCILLILFLIVLMIAPFIILLICDNFGKFDYLEQINMDFSLINGEENACAYESVFDSVRFEDHDIDLKKIVPNKDICDGVSIYNEKLYFTTIFNDNNKYIFSILETDYYGNNQKSIFEKEYDYQVEARSYNKIIYFSEKNNYDEPEIEAFDIVSNEYLGVIAKQKLNTYYHHIYEISKDFTYDFEKHNSAKPGPYLEIKNIDNNVVRSITVDRLSQDNVGQLVLKQKDWSWIGVQWVEGKMYLHCSIFAANRGAFDYSYYNVIFEYDFDKDILQFKFHFISSDYSDNELHFG